MPEGSVVIVDVSTHSRPKAAGGQQCAPNANSWFQHTAARRRLVAGKLRANRAEGVSTHSRPKAAGFYEKSYQLGDEVSTHSRPKAAGC